MQTKKYITPITNHPKNKGQVGIKKYLGTAINACIKKGSTAPGALIMLSFDNLPLIISWYNAKLADQVIDKVSAKLEKKLPEKTKVFRISIDQVGIVILKTTKDQLEQHIKDIYDITQNFEYKNFRRPMHMNISIGSVDFPFAAKNAEDAYSKAYVALSAAQHSGDTFYYDYDEAEKRQLYAKSQTMLVHHIHNAVKRNRITLAYQPIIESASGKVHSYECLLRIIEDDGKLNPAGSVIPTAEKMGFIDIIDEVVLEKVARTLKEHPKIRLALNVSSLTTDNPKWLKLCTNLLKDSKIASRVTVEITETAAQRDLRETAYFVASLQALGCTVALDDFGAGFTSFRQLKTLSVDTIKIDGAFIKDIANHPDNRLFVKTLMDFSRRFGLKTVAECVESGECAKILMDMGIDYMQGYYFGVPENNPKFLGNGKKKK